MYVKQKIEAVAIYLNEPPTITTFAAAAKICEVYPIRSTLITCTVEHILRDYTKLLAARNMKNHIKLVSRNSMLASSMPVARNSQKSYSRGNYCQADCLPKSLR